MPSRSEPPLASLSNKYTEPPLAGMPKPQFSKGALVEEVGCEPSQTTSRYPPEAIVTPAGNGHFRGAVVSSVRLMSASVMAFVVGLYSSIHAGVPPSMLVRPKAFLARTTLMTNWPPGGTGAAFGESGVGVAKNTMLVEPLGPRP